MKQYKEIVFEYDFDQLTEIIRMPNNSGLDFRFNNYPYNDISVETKKWKNIQEFLEWYKSQTEERLMP